jgi:hypothetical protein
MHPSITLLNQTGARKENAIQNRRGPRYFANQNEWDNILKKLPRLLTATLLALLGLSTNARSQDSGSTTPPAQTDGQPMAAADAKPSDIDSPEPKIDRGDSEGRQPKRILGVIPNYRAVSANTKLPPQKIGEKFWLASEDSFDYSNFLFVSALAGISMAGKSEPAFGQGGAGYGRYYWHTFVDVGIGNYMTEAIVPTLTKEDPRYYTLGKGGFLKRTTYAVSRLFITRTDSGRNTFNISEIVGNGAAAGISNAYYPTTSNTFVKTYQRWGTQIALDGVFNICKEFWPDINRSLFHQKY